MKKVLLVLVVPILLLAMISCDSDIMGSINAIKGVLEPLNENVYINTRLYTVDTSQVEAVTTQITAVVSNITTNPTVAPTATITEIKTALTTVLTSPTKLTALKDEMSQEAGLESTADVSRIQDYLPPGVATDSLTKGDLLAAELIYSIAESDVVTDLKNNSSVTEKQKLALASDALQVVEVVKQISSIGEVGVDQIVSDLLAQFGMSGGTSREGESGDDDDQLEFLQPIAVAVVNAIGYDEDDPDKIDSENLARFIAGFTIVRKSYETIALALPNDGIELELGDSINYLLSFVFTFANEFLDPTVVSNASLENVLNYLVPYVKNPELEGNPFPDNFLGDTDMDLLVAAYGETALEDDLIDFADTFGLLMEAAGVAEGNVLYDALLGDDGFLTDIDSIFGSEE
ncbi:MAG: hypothetical protein WDA14_02395 [Sphaerochaetaceae bacterium]